MKRLTLVSLLLIFSLVLAACGGAETPAPAAPTAVPQPDPVEEMEAEPANTIVDIAVNDGRFTTLVAALTAAGLVETLSGEGPFTVFAPTDDAFAALPEGTVESLLADPQGALTDILLYHVVAGRVMAADVLGLTSAATVNGELITIATDSGVVLNDMANVIITDIEASNGVIHVIDAVILPPSMMAEDELPTIVEIAAADERFTTLVAAVTAAGLAETLSGEGPFTVFAPTDDAFAALPAGTIEALLADPQGALTDILLYHVVSGSVLAADVVALDAATTVGGEDIAIAVDGGEVVLNGMAKVIITDIEASNGVIHVIDAVILPPSMMAEAELPSIAEIAVADGRFETLVAALSAAGLVETLSNAGSFTVFAPTDEAFAALPAGTIEALLADPQGALTDILLYHVVSGEVPAAEVVTLDSATTLNGADITITVENGTVLLNGVVQVIITDIMASNGVVHVIDAVLLPSS